MSPSRYLKAGRWTYAEERQLRKLVDDGDDVPGIAMQMQRSEESVAKKLVELDLKVAEPKPPSREQLRCLADAAKHRRRAARFRELAAEEKDAAIAGRLTALALEEDDVAISLEARAAG